jgi:hypothetical protein
MLRRWNACILAVVRIGERIRKHRRSALSIADGRQATRDPMRRALRAIQAEGGCTADYSATLAALRKLQFEGDDEAAQIAYIIWAAESERQGETWAAVEERMAA